MTFQEFVEKYNGKYADKDGKYGAQCMDLANLYVCEVFGYDVTKPSPIGAPTAYQSFENGHDDFVKISSNNPLDYRVGDIVYYSPRINWEADTQSGAGHVGIVHVTYPSGEGFEIFEQNNPVGSKCRLAWSGTRHLVGVLRHKSLINQAKKRMKLFDKAIQLVSIDTPEGDEFYVIWLDDASVEHKRRVKSGITATLALFADNGKYNKWETPEQRDSLSRMPEGAEFSLVTVLTNRPELAKLKE
jgi:hypothetical protein